MGEHKDRLYGRIGVFGTVLLLGLSGYWLLTAVRGPLLAGILSYLTATAIQSPAKRLSRRTGLSRRVSAALLLLFLFLLVGVGVGLGAWRLFYELRDALSRLSLHWEEIGEELGRRVGLLLGGSERAEELTEQVSEWGLGILSRVGTELGVYLGSLLRATPRALMLLGAGCLSCLYLSMDYDRLGGALLSLLPPERAESLGRWRRTALSAVAGYGRAYLCLLLLTFFECFLGLCLLGQRNALLLSCLLALLDLLPFIGTGTVLIPWGLLSLADGRLRFGIGLLILYGVITVLRQLAEPRLVGENLGLHPLAALLAVFLGFWFFGGLGMLLAPPALVMIRAFLVSVKEEKRKFEKNL